MARLKELSRLRAHSKLADHYAKQHALNVSPLSNSKTLKPGKEGTVAIIPSIETKQCAAKQNRRQVRSP